MYREAVFRHRIEDSARFIQALAHRNQISCMDSFSNGLDQIMLLNTPFLTILVDQFDNFEVQCQVRLVQILQVRDDPAYIRFIYD